MKLTKRYLLTRAVCVLSLILATSLVSCAPASSLKGFKIAPSVISPNGDGVDDEATVAYSLTQRSLISIAMLDGAGKEYGFRRDEVRSAGSYTAQFDGAFSPDPNGPERRVMPDGTYVVVFQATPVDSSGNPLGQPEEARAQIVLSGGDTTPPVVSDMVSTYPIITPNGDAIEDETDISYALSKKATVTITAVNTQGDIYLMDPPTVRSAALYSHNWNGTSSGILLPDGEYTVHIQARDLAGNLSEATTKIVIDSGGAPSLEITKVTFSPTVILLGGDLNVQIRVRNNGNVPLRTIGPDPGTPYDTETNFNSLKGPDGAPLYYERAGVWRVGVEWSIAGRSYPVRWALLPAKPDGQYPSLQPGEEAVITGTIKILINQTRLVYFWVSAVQEGVGFPGGAVGRQKIVISF
ncbi:MAG: hypothetical protein Q7R39_05690 [Dehalococcoidia bacterium]|nr:hypothetical protein [Dehalococcoidia bacterium]